MKLIESKTLATAAASIEFTSIPQDGTDLLVLISSRSARAASVSDTGIRFNSDTASNFTSRRLFGDGSNAFSDPITNTFAYVGINPANTATASTFGNFEIHIPNYTGATAKSISVSSVGEQNGTTAYQFIIAGLWSGTAAITTLTLLDANGQNLSVGSTVSLYKITKGSDGIVTTS
jgi:hypothetical protein